jgi:hypothetical protein
MVEAPNFMPIKGGPGRETISVKVVSGVNYQNCDLLSLGRQLFGPEFSYDSVHKSDHYCP